MEYLKSVFGDKALTYAELEVALKDSKEIKLANLASGQYVDKDKFDKSEIRAGDLQKQLNTANDTIKSFKDLNVEDLKTGIKTWETKYKTDTDALNAKLIKQTLDSKIDLALMGEKALNAKAVRALLDSEKIKLDGENVLGLTDQLEAIKKENPFLFGDAKPNNPPAPAGGSDPVPTDLNTTDMSAYINARKKM